MKMFYVLACCLFLAAITTDLAGKHYALQTATISAGAVAGSQSEQALAHLESDAAAHKSDFFTALGMVIAAIGLGAWLASAILGRRQGRRMRPIVPLAMFVAYVLVFLVIV
jgi:hypothetical protein